MFAQNMPTRAAKAMLKELAMQGYKLAGVYLKLLDRDALAAYTVCEGGRCILLVTKPAVLDMLPNILVALVGGGKHNLYVRDDDVYVVFSGRIICVDAAITRHVNEKKGVSELLVLIAPMACDNSAATNTMYT